MATIPTVIGTAAPASSAAAFNLNFTTSGRLAGHRLFIIVMTANQSIATPSGFTPVLPDSGTPSRGTAGAAGGVATYVFTKISVGTEGNISIPDSGDIQMAAGLVVAGDLGFPTAIGESVGGNAASATSCSFTGPATTKPDALVIGFVCIDRDASGSFWSGQANANLANVTERIDRATATGTGGGVMVFTGEKATAGAVGNSTGTQSTASAYTWITLALYTDVPAGDVYAVGSDADDVSRGLDGTWLPTGVLLQGSNNSGTGLGVRFTGITVPQGATIASANLVLVTANTTVTGTQWGSIFGDDVDNAAAWSSVSHPLAITKTAASVAVKSSKVNLTPLVHDVTAIVQELVDRAGWSSGNAIRFGGDPTGANGNMRFWDYSLDPADVARLYIEYSAGGSVPSVTPASAAHPHTASAPTVAAKSTTAPASSAHLQTASAPTLAAKSVAAPASVAHLHTGSSPSLAARNTAAPASSAHVTTASDPTVGVPVIVAPDSASHTHTASSPAIAARNTAAPASAAHLTAAGQAALAARSTVLPASSAHTTAASEPTVTARATTAPASGAHDTASSSPSLAPHVAVAPDPAAHITAATAPTVAPADTVQPASATHTTTASSPGITPRATAAPASSAHDTSATAPTLAAGGSLQPASAAHATACSSPTLATVSGAITPEYAAHLTAAASASVAARSNVSPDGAAHATDASSPALVSSYIPTHTESRSAGQVRRSASLGQLRASASIEQSRRTASVAQSRKSAAPLQVRASRSIPQRRRT